MVNFFIVVWWLYESEFSIINGIDKEVGIDDGNGDRTMYVKNPILHNFVIYGALSKQNFGKKKKKEKEGGISRFYLILFHQTSLFVLCSDIKNTFLGVWR